MRNLIKSISTRTGAAKFSMVVIICLIILKVVVSIISRSISISAQAADSILDIFSIGITLLALNMSVTPADEDHPFGHGKAEGLAAFIQAILVLGAGGFIIYTAINRIIHSTTIKPEEGIIVMIISIITSILLSRHLHRVASATGSTAIDASARNISADVYSAAGVLFGLLIVRLTKLVILDPIIALIMAGFVLKAGREVTIRAIHELIDHALPKEEQDILINCLDAHNTQIVEYHAVRSRRSGNERFIDLHIVMKRNISFENVHDMCDHLEKDIKEKLTNANVIIHAEPCTSENCSHCSITICDLRGA
ncbi:MAG TPA: cation diffusion facilitator family transporter [Desulfobacteraceae bacterium]|nr:cation diffusion facilitator family transporter [Desulfobacteraceae bacterium]HPQ27038.1 cation diffusion facilitator family transporter [Desulfobacteraceae bacterium]